ncbi:TPA: MarR family transcriptional regulator [Klebsiella michiganensis]|nr:MarR family transcriptional regulator [Klebsiella michiganensis]
MSTGYADHSDLLLELARTTLNIARKLQAYAHQNPDVVPLSPLESLLLMNIQQCPGVSPSDLANDLSLRSSNAAAALRGLVEKGLVERHSDPSDKRVIQLHLTLAARDSIMAVHRSWKSLLMQPNIPEEDLHAAVRVLCILNSTLAEY